MLNRRDFLKASVVSAGVAASLRGLDSIASAQAAAAGAARPASEADFLIARVDFTKPIRPWDGFGLNYVEACQTRDYAKEPQDYGGFSIMNEQERQRVLNLAFGPGGLRPGAVKMFLDPFHQPTEPSAAKLDSLEIDLADYDHQTTTKWMRHFVKNGLSLMQSQGLSFDVIVTLYGPPGWMTKQKFIRGRDLDPKYRIACAKYMVSWAKYLRDVEKIPVKYISLHNEGEDWIRWPVDGRSAGWDGHDYNMFWPPEQVVDFIKLVRQVLDHNKMPDVGVTPGEPTNWLRFQQWGYADAIADDPEAVRALGLITSHGFHGSAFSSKDPAITSRWAGDWRSTGIDTLRAKKPELHSWVTSTSWAKMRAAFVWELVQNIYSAGNNAIIPWACIQRSQLWKQGDPNPGCAFRVDDDGKVTVEPGYHYYRQACRAGRRGTQICRATLNSGRCAVMGFASDGANNPNAAVIINAGEGPRRMTVELKGGKQTYRIYRTSPKEEDADLGTLTLANGRAVLEVPADSVVCLVEA